MGKKVYTASSLTGGAEGSLDAINGSLLADGDLAIVTYGGRAYLYELDHDNSSAETSPWIISPDKNYGTMRWIWQPVEFGNATLARAYLTSNQAINHNPSPPTKVSGYTEDFDIGGNFASDKYTAPATGYYHVDFSILFYDAESKLYHTQAAIYKNGTSAIQGSITQSTDKAWSQCVGSSIIYLAAGDYLELYGYIATTDSSAAVMNSGSNATFFSVYLVSKG